MARLIKTITGKAPESPDDILVSETDLKRCSNLIGIRQILDREHGEGQWGDAEVTRYLQAKRFTQWKGQIEAVMDVETAREFDPIEERFQKYTASYEGLTPNDEEMILNLCAIEHQLEGLRKTIRDTKLTTGNSADIQRLMKAQTDLTKEHRQIQKLLGIEREARKDKKDTALDLVRREIEKGREFVEEKLTPLKHCEIQLGWVLYHFEELPHRFDFMCPRCGGECVIEGGDSEEAKKVLERLKEQR